MPKLKDTPILPQYKENERYIKTQIFGNFNSFFCELINNIMNKFPLEFDFEGAFYKCWHI